MNRRCRQEKSLSLSATGRPHNFKKCGRGHAEAERMDHV